MINVAIKKREHISIKTGPGGSPASLDVIIPSTAAAMPKVMLHFMYPTILVEMFFAVAAGTIIREPIMSAPTKRMP